MIRPSLTFAGLALADEPEVPTYDAGAAFDRAILRAHEAHDRRVANAARILAEDIADARRELARTRWLEQPEAPPEDELRTMTESSTYRAYLRALDRGDAGEVAAARQAWLRGRRG